MRVEAYLEKVGARGDCIVVRFPGSDKGEGYYAAKAVSASRKLRDTAAAPETVVYPLSVDKCIELREAFPSLKVHKSLGDWYRIARVTHQQQVARTSHTDAKLTVVDYAYPELGKYLFGDQRVTAAWLANAYRGGGLLADEVGTGKTVGVLAGLVEAHVTGPTLIVCPKISVKSVWAKEFAQHMPNVPVYLGRGTRVAREKALAAFAADKSAWKVLVITAEMLRIKAIRSRGRVEQFIGYEFPELFEVDWAAVVVDESHKLLGSMDVVKGNLAGEGLRALSYAPHRLKLAVSATPFGKGGRIDALFGTLHWLWPDEFPGRWAWLSKYFEISEGRVFVRGGGGQTKIVKRIGSVKGGAEGEAQLWRELGPRVLRRTMEEVSPAHRGLKSWVEVPCEMEQAQRKMYEAFVQDAEIPVEGGILSSVGVLDFMIRCRQIANGLLRKEGGRVVYTGESAKIDKLIAHLDGLEPTRKVVIASQYNEFLDVVEARLEKEGYLCVRLDGKTSESQREARMNAFQNTDEVQIFLINSQAGGVSITLDAAEEMHQLDEMYPPEANTQLYGRIFRRGRAHQVIYYMYRSMGTIDEKIGFNVNAGHVAQLKLLDGRRGLEYVRELAKYGEK